MDELKSAAVVYTLLALIIMLPLLCDGYYLALDMQFGPNTFSEFQFSDLYGYEANPYGAYLPLWLVFSALSQIISIEIIQKLLLFSIVFLCGFLMHVFLPKGLGNSRYFAGLLYMLNPFVFVRFLAGHWSLLLSYALWPIAIKFFMEFLKAPGERNKLAKVALVTFLASISSHGVILLLMSYLILFLLHVIKAGSGRLPIKKTMVIAVIVLAMNLFWIVPTISTFGERYSTASPEDYLADFGAVGEELPVSLAVLTMHGFWRSGFTYTKDVFELWYVPYLIIAALCFMGLLVVFREDRRKGVFFFTLFIMAFLLAIGDEAPHAWIYSFLEGIPISFLFRDTQKFVGLLSLVYSVLGAYGVHYLTQRTEGKKRAVLLIGLLAIPVIYNFGFFGFLDQIGPTEYPEDWAEADKIIAADNTTTNILVLPLHTYNVYPWVNSTQKTLGNPASQFFSKPVITAKNVETEHVYSDFDDPQGEYLRYMFANRQYVNNTAEMLLPLNVRYIVLFKYDFGHVHYLYLFYREGGVENIELVYEGPDLYLFRNNLARGPFIASKENGSGNFTELMNLTGQNLYSADVSYEEITPASYRVLETPYQYLVFTKPYNRFVGYEGDNAFSWHGLASGFVFTEEGVVENRMFYYVLALFLLSWLIAVVLIIKASRRELLVLVILFIAVYLFVSNGLIGHYAFGWLLILSITGSAVYRCIKKDENVGKSLSTKLFKYAQRKR